MAILINGKANCVICGQPIVDWQNADSFPSFIENELDPLFFFNDSSFHRQCLDNHPLGRQVRERYQDFETANASLGKICTICGEQIKDPDNFFILGYITGDISHWLHRYNYARTHKTCLTKWFLLNDVLRFLVAEHDSGQNRGRAIDYKIRTLRNALSNIT